MHVPTADRDNVTNQLRQTVIRLDRGNYYDVLILTGAGVNVIPWRQIQIVECIARVLQISRVIGLFSNKFHVLNLHGHFHHVAH